MTDKKNLDLFFADWVSFLLSPLESLQGDIRRIKSESQAKPGSPIQPAPSLIFSALATSLRTGQNVKNRTSGRNSFDRAVSTAKFKIQQINQLEF